MASQTIESRKSSRPPTQAIELRGVAVHNLREIDLDIPLGKLIVICGVSGSGKTSLALDTLYTEGQRRYIESFSTYTRQFLEKLEKPAARSISGLPAAIAVQPQQYGKSNRSTVGSVTELDDYLQLLFAKLAQPYCDKCGQLVEVFTPTSAVQKLLQEPAGTRAQLVVEQALPAGVQADQVESLLARCREQGYLRLLFEGQTTTLDDPTQAATLQQKILQKNSVPQTLGVVMDRVKVDPASERRLRESFEVAFRQPNAASIVAFVEASEMRRVAGDEQREDPEQQPASHRESTDALSGSSLRSSPDTHGDSTNHHIDGTAWRRLEFPTELRCQGCGQTFPAPTPALFNPNSPLGACPECEGFGNLLTLDPALIVPDPTKSIRAGAIAPWNTPSYAHELEELLALAPEYDLPVDVPYTQLTASQKKLIEEGVPAKKFGGLRGFFAWLEKRKYKMHIRVFHSRWRSSTECPACHGQRLNPTALAFRIGEHNFAALERLSLTELLKLVQEKLNAETTRSPASMILEQVQQRLLYLEQTGLGYLSLHRLVRTLSTGEAQRINLTAALGSSLVNVLYVLDEPTLGLHPTEVDRVVQLLKKLRDRGNTVIAVEHNEAVLRAADQLIEIGPGAGERGGQVVFQGTPAEILEHPHSATGAYLAGERFQPAARTPRETNHGWLRITGARGNNLQKVTADFPLGLLTVVCGVSASGKSTLLEQTLYPGLCRKKKIDSDVPLPFDALSGDGQLEDVILIDQSPIGKTPRSNPATYLKILDEIRRLFADTVDARTHNYGPGHFSFNVAGGRCDVCEGDGYQRIDMQFLPDVFMKCPACQGRRFRSEILKVEYRNRNIADVLDMTAREAFTFFRGAPEIQKRLKQLLDVGLEYLRLGQPANTLSAGESQRLKLAAYIASLKKSRTLFLLDEPTIGLHFSDVTELLSCFQSLLDVGHSLIVADHHPLIIQAADYLVELGPGSAADGGRIIAKGTPAEVRKLDTPTGRLLKQWKK
jgi:excinuclease ABC subunit A